MRYFYLLFFCLLSLNTSSVFASEPAHPEGCVNKNFYGGQQATVNAVKANCASNATINLIKSWTEANTPYVRCLTCAEPCFPEQVYNAATKSCSCPEGTIQGVGAGGAITCTPDEPAPDECDPPLVEFAGLCRMPESSPDQCGSTYSTANAVQGGYICSNDENCGDGSNPSIYTTVNGSWKVCGSPDNNPSSSGSNSSPPSSTPSNGGNSSAGNGSGGDSSSGGSGSGNGSGSGDGNGSGNNSSSPSDSGSGSGDEGIGNGTAAAANCNDNEPECDGDPIQCAMLVQLWINNCAGYDDVELANVVEDNEAIRDNFDALMSSAEPSVNAEGVLTAMTPGGGAGNGTGSGSGSGTGSGNGSGNGGGIDLSGLGDAAASGAGGTCPADRAISLGAGNFNISYQFFCDFASQISGLVLLIFSYIGGMIIYRSLQW